MEILRMFPRESEEPFKPTKGTNLPEGFDYAPCLEKAADIIISLNEQRRQILPKTLNNRRAAVGKESTNDLVFTILNSTESDHNKHPAYFIAACDEFSFRMKRQNPKNP